MHGNVSAVYQVPFTNTGLKTKFYDQCSRLKIYGNDGKLKSSFVLPFFRKELDLPTSLNSTIIY